MSGLSTTDAAQSTFKNFLVPILFTNRIILKYRDYREQLIVPRMNWAERTAVQIFHFSAIRLGPSKSGELSDEIEGIQGEHQ